MYLEIGTLIEDALGHPTTGYTAQLLGLKSVKGLGKPEPVCAILAPWNNRTIAAEGSDSLPTNALAIMQVLEPVWEGEAAQQVRNTEEFQWLVMHLTKVEDEATRWAQGSYAIRAILAALASSLLLDTYDENRKREGVAIEICQRVTTDVHGSMPVGDAHVNAVAALYFGVRDYKPIITQG